MKLKEILPTLAGMVAWNLGQSFISFVFLKLVALFSLNKPDETETVSVIWKEIIQHWVGVWPGSAFLVMSVS